MTPLAAPNPALFREVQHLRGRAAGLQAENNDLKERIAER